MQWWLIATRVNGVGLRNGYLDLEVALDLLYGPVFFRLLTGHAPLDASFVEKLVRELRKGLIPR